MRARILGFTFFWVAISLVSSAVTANDESNQVSDSEIKKMIISESINSYPGRCPCPYNSAKNGSRCGGRSAWSKAGGYSPICYDSDVTDEMVSRWRATH